MLITFGASLVCLLLLVAVTPIGRSVACIRTQAFTPPLAPNKMDTSALRLVAASIFWFPYTALKFAVRVGEANWSHGCGELRYMPGLVVTLRGTGTRWPGLRRGLGCGVGFVCLAGVVFTGGTLLYDFLGPLVFVLMLWLLCPLAFDLEPRVVRKFDRVVMYGFAKSRQFPGGAVSVLQGWLNPYSGRCSGVAKRDVVDKVYVRLVPRPDQVSTRSRFGVEWVFIEW